MNELPHMETVDEGDAPRLNARDSDLDALCESWVYWCRSRRLYWPVSEQGAAIARQGGGTRPLRVGSGVAKSSASLAAFHVAYTCQPRSLDKQVFDLYYVERVKPIKTAAAALGIGRAHFYRVLEEFRRRLASAARAFEQNGAQLGATVGDEEGSSVEALHVEVPAVNSESVSQLRDNLEP